MVKMDQVQTIRFLHFKKGWTARRIAREVGLSRNTVRKYLGQDQSEPRRVELKPRACALREEVELRVRAIVEEWAARTTKKQRITGTRLHHHLRKVEKVDVGVTLVREIWAEIQRERAEVYITLVHRPGDEVQVDFFEVTVDVAGERRNVWKLLVRLVSSGMDFVWLYEHCDQVSFLDGHVRAFAYFGGVPNRGVYDNLAAAVRRVVLPKRELTERFLAMTSHYLLEPCFARVRTGHDKGSVEARGKGIRLAHLTPIPAGNSLEELSLGLVQGLEEAAPEKKDVSGRTVAQKFEEERLLLRPLPAADFEPRKAVPVSVSSRATFNHDGVPYSVPERWARLDATVYVGPADIRVLCRGEEVLKQRRRRGESGIEYRHFLGELSRKPQAVRQVSTELLAELGEPFGRYWRLLCSAHPPLEAARALARVLGAIQTHGEESVREALEQALKADRADLLALGRKLRPEPPTVAVPERLSQVEVEMARAADFDFLLSGGEA